jgi:hypothetical protein
METIKSTSSVANDVLHNESHSKLSAEEIAKAVAHHKRHHPETQTARAAKPAAGKKNK